MKNIINAQIDNVILNVCMLIVAVWHQKAEKIKFEISALYHDKGK
jgi:hypothetical protein